MRGWRTGAVVAGGLLAIGAAPVEQGFEARIPVAPAVVPVGGVPMLRYEVHLSNFASVPLVLETGAVAPGMRSVVYFDVAAKGARAPVIAYSAKGEARRVSPLGFAIDRRALPELGPPLRGGPWAAVYSTDGGRGHRRVVYAVAGRATIPGRFAIDWFRLDEAGRHARGQGERPGDWFGEGAEVLAVADGIVASTRDGMAEHATTDAPTPPLGDATGNYVSLDIGDGRFAFYEHLKPGLRVRPGQRVRKGQVIARLGFSGQTTGPHLHFHLADANSPLGAEGLPYVLKGATVLGGYPSIEAVFAGGGRWRPAPPVSGAFFPAPNSVIRFPEGR